jgi:hypothetical protein
MGVLGKSKARQECACAAVGVDFIFGVYCIFMLFAPDVGDFSGLLSGKYAGGKL